MKRHILIFDFHWFLFYRENQKNLRHPNIKKMFEFSWPYLTIKKNLGKYKRRRTTRASFLSFDYFFPLRGTHRKNSDKYLKIWFQIPYSLGFLSTNFRNFGAAFDQELITPRHPDREIALILTHNLVREIIHLGGHLHFLFLFYYWDLRYFKWFAYVYSVKTRFLD